MRARDIKIGTEYYYRKRYPGVHAFPRRGRVPGSPGSTAFTAIHKAIAMEVADGYVSMEEKYITTVDSKNKVVDLADRLRMESGYIKKRKLHNVERTRTVRVKTRDIVGEVHALPVSEAEAVHVGETSEDRPSVDEKVRVQTPAEEKA